MEISLPRDPRWDIQEKNSFEYFKSLSKQIQFRPEISDEIVNRFAVVKRLLAQSYFVYDFIDVAYERALLTLEMAIKIRYEEIEGKIWKKNLKKLIDWAESKHLFEDDSEVIHKLRKFRNRVAHPEKYTLLGIAGVDIVARIVEVINGLYDSVEKRKERIDKEEDTNKKLGRILRTGGILEINSQKLEVFYGTLLYFDNQLNPPTYYFAFIETFDPRFKEKRLITPDPVIVATDNFVFQDDELLIKSNDTNSIRLAKIEEKTNQKDFIKFLTKLEQCVPASSILNYQLGNKRRQIKQRIGRKLAERKS